MPYTASSRRKAASRGGYRVRDLYGNPGTTEGRRKGGLRSIQIQHSRARNEGNSPTKFQLRKEFKHPKRSALLAELIGAILGDGCISDYQVQICFHRGYEQEYMQFLRETISKLFSIDSGLHYSKKDAAGYVTISNVGVIEFLAGMGLRERPKRIPSWIFNRPSHQRACVRGLVDTDGSIYPHRLLC